MMKNKPLALYIHIPFCLKKCNYCDFCSFADLPEKTRREYVRALVSEIMSYRTKVEQYRVKSIFFGGGTPSLLRVDDFEAIVAAIRKTFLLQEEIEFTIEANPKTLTKEKIIAFARSGVNRVSIGLQSIHENEMKKLGRIHDYQDFLDSLQMVLDGGIHNINVDIMYAIPEQTVESFKKTVDAVVCLPITHISAYSLIIEDGTPFGNMRDTLALPDESDELQMVEYLRRTLSEHGFSHYEISNYAKEGYACRHNLVYWNAEEYIGFGICASSYFEGVRFTNTSSLDEYLSTKITEYRTEEFLSESEKAFEYAMLRLRLTEGLSLSEYERRFGYPFAEGKKEEIQKYISVGLLRRSGDFLALTEEGLYVSNEILARLL